MVIIAANSGGAFSPIGDVTTIMLWIGGQVTTLNIILKTFIPSVISIIIPLIILSVSMKGEIKKPAQSASGQKNPTSSIERNIVFFLGISLLLFVPVFKTLTSLPPYLGILLGLGILWVVTEIMHKEKNDANRPLVTVAGVLRRVDTPSVLFFLGILLAVAALQSAGHLLALGNELDRHIGNLYLINVIIGLLSAVVDNVPLVAGAIGMYRNIYPADHYFWEMLAYCAGTGGSILIIGSAAGVAVMGMEKIDFAWYLKKISLLALIGYLAGALIYWIMNILIF
jgi:Na+/H+ antiporter NhaD/arsenite permease-like protein